MTVVNRETGEITEPLTAMERSALTHAEAAIEQGAAQVADALAEIRDKRLYKEDYATFEAYCRERWGMSKRNVDYKIVAGEVAGLLGTIVPTGQARELADLRNDPEQLRDTYRKAHEQTGGNVTAAAIREVRNLRTPEPESEGEADDGSGHTPQGEPPRGGRPGETATPRPAVTGLDGKTYSRPVPKPAPSKPKRSPLTDSFFRATYDASKKVESLRRLIDDDRFPQNAEKVAASHRNDLLRTRDLLQQVIDSLPEQETTP